MSHDSAPLPTVVQINIYRERNGRFEYLLLKRIDRDAHFWQVITEPVPSHSTLADTLKNAEETQIGVRGFKHLSHEMYSYEWYAHGERGRDIVFAAELDPATVVYPDRGRYSDYAWLPFDEAMQHLKWNGNKEALRRLNQHLMAKRQDNPLPHSDGSYHRLPSEQPDSPDDPHAVSQADPHATARPARPGTPARDPYGPYGPNVPKRLPDRPEDRPATIDDDEANTSALFL